MRRSGFGPDVVVVPAAVAAPAVDFPLAAFEARCFGAADAAPDFAPDVAREAATLASSVTRFEERSAYRISDSARSRGRHASARSNSCSATAAAVQSTHASCDQPRAPTSMR